MSTVPQQILDRALKALGESSGKLDEGHNPVEILRRSGMRKLMAQQALEELHKQGKIGLMRGSKEEIVATFIDTGEEPEKSRLFVSGACIVLVDVENIRIQMELRRNMFPGDAILAYLQKMKFLVTAAYAFTNNKAPAGTIVDQQKLLSEQGFTVIPCYDVKDIAGDAVDWRMAEIAKSHLGNPEIQAFVVISGDRDFKWLRDTVTKNGHDFFVISHTSNIADEWRNKTKALPLVLDADEQDALAFLEEVLTGLGKSIAPDPKTDDEKRAFAFLISLVSVIGNLKSKSINNFQDTCRTLRRALPGDIKELYSEEFVDALVSIIIARTDLIRRRQFVSYSQNGVSEFQKYFKI